MSRTHARRSFLRGAGVTLALPFLPSALPRAMWSGRAHASTCTPPRRFMAWFVPNGMVMPAWTPTTAGTSTWAATPILSSVLDPVRSKIAILTGLDHQDIAVPPGTAGLVGDHAAGTGCFLNMIPVSGHETDSARTSIDQALLATLNSGGCYSPILPSLQVGVQTNSGQCDRANCSFVRSISWINGAPLPTLYDPGLIFDKLFGGAHSSHGRRPHPSPERPRCRAGRDPIPVPWIERRRSPETGSAHHLDQECRDPLAATRQGQSHRRSARLHATHPPARFPGLGPGSRNHAELVGLAATTHPGGPDGPGFSV